MKFKSKFEKTFNDQYGKSLKGYETTCFTYVLTHTYTPDWKVSETVFLETKGRWLSSDRTKIVKVLAQNPRLKLAMVFMKADTPINKGSTTTYADYCDKKGITWFDQKDTAGINKFIRDNQ